MSPWEVLGWAASVCGCVLLVGATFAIVAGGIRQAFKPTPTGPRLVESTPPRVVLPTGNTSRGGVQPPRGTR